MKVFVLAAAAAAVVLASGPSVAADLAGSQPAPAASAAQDEATTARRTALARRYFVALHYQATMASAIKSLMPVMLDAEMKRHASLPPGFKQALTDAAVETLDDITPRITEDAVKGMAQLFTEEELTKLVAFYESDVGQAIMAKAPQLSQVMSNTMKAVMPQMQTEMLERLCRKIDCSSLPKSPQTHPS
jgi:hypothetical protein